MPRICDFDAPFSLCKSSGANLEEKVGGAFPMLMVSTLDQLTGQVSNMTPRARKTTNLKGILG
jgi:hypothetical protein